MKKSITKYRIPILISITIIVILISTLSNKSTTVSNIDSISSASKKYYYENSSLKDEALKDTLRNNKGAITVSTTNEDNTPNCAVVSPTLLDDNIIMFRLVDNQTKINIKERKLAVLTTYIYNPEALEKKDKNMGARLILKYIEDKDTVNELFKKNNVQNVKDSIIFMNIEKILPLG